MSDPYLSEIRIFAGNFAPRNWATCDGQILSISQNTALFSLLGTNFGGNGQTTFALPNMQGRAPVHMFQGPGLSDYAIGEQTGTESVTLLTTEMPAHTHQLMGGTTAGSTGQTSGTPTSGSVLSLSSPGQVYINTATSLIAMAPQTITIAGGSLPHENRQPFLALLYMIAISGIFPARN